MLRRRKAAPWAVVGLFLGGGAAAPLLPGCNLINPPQPEPTATPAPTPRADLFDPADGAPTTPFVKLNGTAPQPAKFRVIGIPSGEILQLQSLVGAAPNFRPGGPGDPMRLSGVVTPAPGQPGYDTVVAEIAKRTLGPGKEVDVEQDPRFPTDLDQRRLVQVYYQGTGTQAGQRLLLNRMLVRLGYAVVDINAPTSANVQAWLNDEEFAREKKLGLNALGITIAQRIPVAPPTNVLRAPAERIARPRRPVGGASAPGGTTTTSTTTTSSTTTSRPGAPGGSAGGRPGGPPPGFRPGGPPPGFRPGGPPPGSPGGPPLGGRPGGPPPGGRPGGPPPGASTSSSGPISNPNGASPGSGPR